MMPFSRQMEVLVEQGYGQAAAQAKVAHDAILLAMDVCGFKRHSTVKGGIVMSHDCLYCSADCCDVAGRLRDEQHRKAS